MSEERKIRISQNMPRFTVGYHLGTMAMRKEGDDPITVEDLYEIKSMVDAYIYLYSEGKTQTHISNLIAKSRIQESIESGRWMFDYSLVYKSNSSWKFDLAGDVTEQDVNGNAVYFFEHPHDETKIKIGYSSKLTQRFHGAKLGGVVLPSTVVNIKATVFFGNDDTILEKAFHTILDQYRIEREWFFKPPVIDYLNSIKLQLENAS